MKALILILTLSFVAFSQTPAKQLRDEYVKSSDDLISSLEHLQAGYEKSLAQARDREAQARGLLSQELLPPAEYDKAYYAVKQQERNVESVRSQLDSVRNERDNLPSLKEMEKAFRASQKRERQCQNWRLTATQRISHRSTEIAFRFVCKT